jgi:transaldolase
MVKIPATAEGIPAIEELLAQGVNVNVTLMFSLEHYNAVASAFLRGIERAPDPTRVASVASVFVSRVDTAVDRALDEIGTPAALALRGKVAIANAKVIYARFRERFYSARFAALRSRGVRVQRVLWGSTGTKHPACSDVFYVEELIGPDTIDTVPPATLQAFREHGRVRGLALDEGLSESKRILNQLSSLGINLSAITQQLQTAGVAAFGASLSKLLSTLQAKQHGMVEASN